MIGKRRVASIVFISAIAIGAGQAYARGFRVGYGLVYSANELAASRVGYIFENGFEIALEGRKLGFIDATLSSLDSYNVGITLSVGLD